MLGVFGTDMYSTGVNALGNFLNGAIANFWDKKADARHFEYNEKAADNADARQRAQYKDMYSPEAMLQQYAAAGLSPSMMMSGGAPAVGGTASGPQGQGTMGGGLSGVHFGTQPANPLFMAELDLKKAQAENLRSDSALKDVEKNFTLANIANVLQDTENKKMYHRVLTIQTSIDQINLNILEIGEPHILAKIINEAKKAYNESELLAEEVIATKWANKFTVETYATRVKQMTASLEKTFSEIGLNKAQAESLADHVAIARYNANTENYKAQITAQWYEDQVEQWAKKNEIDLKEQNKKLAADLIGTLCHTVVGVADALIPG